jgi:hypothetical protein
MMFGQFPNRRMNMKTSKLLAAAIFAATPGTWSANFLADKLIAGPVDWRMARMGAYSNNSRSVRTLPYLIDGCDSPISRIRGRNLMDAYSTGFNNGDQGCAGWFRRDPGLRMQPSRCLIGVGRCETKIFPIPAVIQHRV